MNDQTNQAHDIDLVSFCHTYISHPDVETAIKEPCRVVAADPENPTAILQLALAFHKIHAWNAMMFVLAPLIHTPSPHQIPALALLTHYHIADQNDEQTKAHEAELARCFAHTPDAFNNELVRHVATTIYQWANTDFNQGEVDLARRTYNILLPYDTAVHHMGGTYLKQPEKVRSATPSLSDSECMNILETAQSQWHREDREIPEFALPLQKQDLTPIESFKGKKILLVMRERFFRHKDSRPHELIANFKHTATQLGLDVQTYGADPMVWWQKENRECRLEHITGLMRKILEWKPDYVVVDELCHQEGDPLLGPPGYRDILATIKKKHPFKLIGLYADPWAITDLNVVSIASEVADVIWHPDPKRHEHIKTKARCETVCTPFPFPVETFAGFAEPKEIQASFVGTSLNYNYLRSLWLLALTQRTDKFHLQLTSPLPPQDNRPVPMLTYEEYARLLGKSAISLQFSARNESMRMTCGRVWEAIHARSLLLEEDTEQTRQFLVPYVHYVPFSNIDELVTWLDFFSRHEPLRAQIIDEASQWMTDTLSTEHIWGTVLEAAG